jgi:phenylalanyl-tRNA synthetase alpha chain
METVKQLPVRIIAPGAAYRRDEIDATHLSVFNQLEGLYCSRQKQMTHKNRQNDPLCPF